MCLVAVLVLVVVSGQEPDSGENAVNQNSTTSAGGEGSTVPASFRPSIAVIVGVLTTMFSLTFLLLIYAKHCKRNPVGVFGAPDDPAVITPQQLVFRADTGIDPAVVEALPTFSFSSLKGNKDGLECAVCLCKYDDRELLRLLPKCKHAFHVDCVDTWLASHSTCPLCRNRVTADDLLVVDEMMLLMLSSRRRSTEHQPNLVAACEQQQPALGQSRSSLDIDLGSGPAFQIYVQRSDEQDGKANSESQAEDHVRLGHRIIVSDVVLQTRWSDLLPSDVLFLSNSHTLFWPSTDRCMSFTASSSSRVETNKPVSLLKRALSLGRYDSRRLGTSSQRCMSEMSGLDRFSNTTKCKELLPLSVNRASDPDRLMSDEGGNNNRWIDIARRTLNLLMRRQTRMHVPATPSLQKPSGSETA